MSKQATWQTVTHTAIETERVGERIGAVLKGGEIIELVSDLGGGKTTFTRGLVRGIGSKDPVASPTFTISKLYEAGDIEIHHFDFYRLAEAGIVANELAEVAGEPDTITIVEWAGVVQHVLPAERLTVAINQTPEGNRQLLFTIAPSLHYIAEALQS